MRYANIVGAGHHVPENKITNDFFDKKYNQDMSTFLVEKRNIMSRYFMAKEECTSDLILPAAEKALKNSGLEASDLDLIIVSTDTPDYISPSTASVVQYRLGAKNAGAFDINSACAGFVIGCDMAWKYIAADQKYKNILVVGAYGMSKYFNWEDYKVTSVFADGAGAVVISESDEPGFIASELYADGQFHDYMGIYAGGTKTNLSHEALEKGEHCLQFKKKIPVETNGVHWPRLTNNLLDRIEAKASDIDTFFLTQINIGSINEALDSLGLEHSKSHNVMNKFGYTGSACIPMAVSDAVENHKLKKGDLVFMLGSGGGMSMGALAMKWGFDS